MTKREILDKLGMTLTMNYEELNRELSNDEAKRFEMALVTMAKSMDELYNDSEEHYI